MGTGSGGKEVHPLEDLRAEVGGSSAEVSYKTEEGKRLTELSVKQGLHRSHNGMGCGDNGASKLVVGSRIRQGPRAWISLERIIKFIKNNMPGDKNLFSESIKATKYTMRHTITQKNT